MFVRGLCKMSYFTFENEICTMCKEQTDDFDFYGKVVVCSNCIENKRGL